MSELVKIPEDLMLNAKDFMRLLKEQGMVIGPRTVFESNLVDGIPLEQFRERVMRKKLLTTSDVSKAQLWGKIGRKAVTAIVRNQIDEKDILRLENGYIRIPREVVRSIAASRGFDV